MDTPESPAHVQRRAALREQLARSGSTGLPWGLSKTSSNLFRDRFKAPRQALDLSAFCQVLEINTEEGWVDVEGLCSYEDLVDACLARGVMPAVVPQLKSITAGGAVAGVGIEASSFRQGLVHDTLLELDVLLPGGVLTCTPDNAHSDLFRGFPNSYGTLGYALRLRLRTLPVKPLVRIEHRRHASGQTLFDDLALLCAGDADFIDGVVFSGAQQVLCVARFCEHAEQISDYGLDKMYYRSLLERERDSLRTRDFLWRWDTDWFWCSKNFGLQHLWLRRLLGRERLNSRNYARWMRWNARWGITRRLARLRGLHSESVIQDVDIPLQRAPEFLNFLLRDIGITPIWLCPIRPAPLGAGFSLYPLQTGQAYVNFGFWDQVRSREKQAPGHFNRLVEARTLAVGGIKSLYSTSWFDRETFDAAYGGETYSALKARYDPQGQLGNLYDKCVGK